MTMRHISSGKTNRQRAYFWALLRIVVVFGVVLSVFNAVLGNLLLCLMEGSVVLYALYIRKNFDKSNFTNRIAYGFLISLVLVSLYAFASASSAEVFIWAALAWPIGLRMFGQRLGSILSVAYLAIVLSILFVRYGLDGVMDNPSAVIDVIGVGIVLIILTYEHERDLRQADRQLRERADLDGLTRLAARLRLQELFDTAREQSRDRRGEAEANVSMLLVDLDHFKQINDTYGHSAGDCVLRVISRRLLDNSRKDDFLGRTGGEELAILLFGVPHEAAVKQAERLRCCIADSPVMFESIEIRVTVSIGVATCELPTISFSEIFDRADKRLYVAKSSGRNRVHGEPVSESI